MVYVNEGESATAEGCSAYMRYENFLRKQETGIGSVVGVDGGIDAVRKELYSPMQADQLPDFVLPLQVVTKTTESSTNLQRSSGNRHLRAAETNTG